MNHNFLLILLFSVFMACNYKAEKHNGESESAKHTSVINQIVGIGKITPEQDIIQLSSPVNGIVYKIIKKENDPVNVGTVILELEHHIE